MCGCGCVCVRRRKSVRRAPYGSLCTNLTLLVLQVPQQLFLVLVDESFRTPDMNFHEPCVLGQHAMTVADGPFCARRYNGATICRDF